MATEARFFLPPRIVPRLIGREAELHEIMARLSSPTERTQVVAVEGVAGLGKTALAHEVALRFVEAYNSLPPDARFDIILWATAHPSSLPPPTHVDQQSYTSLDDIFRAVAVALEIPTLMQVPPEQRAKQCWAALELNERVLLVIDNMEEDADDSISGFLRNLPVGTRALVTTRFHENLPYPLRLRPLEPAAARELIAAECAARGLKPTKDQLKTLSESIQAMPLAACLIVGQCAEKGFDAVLRAIDDMRTQIASDILGRSVEHLKQRYPHSYQCLLAFALFDFVAGASGEALAACLGLDAKTAAGARELVEYLNLAQPVREPAQLTIPAGAAPGEGLRQLDAAVQTRNTVGRYSVLPLTYEYMQHELAQHRDWQRQARQRQVEYYRGIASQLGDPARYQAAAVEADNLIRVMRGLVDAGDIGLLASFFDASQEFLYAQSRWDELLLEFATPIRDALRQARAPIAPRTLIALLQSPIDIYRRRGQMQVHGEPWVDSIQKLSHGLHDRLLESEIDLARRRLFCNDGTLGTTTQLIPMPVSSPDEFDAHLRRDDPDFVDDVKTAVRVFTAAGRADKVFQAHVTLGNFHRVLGSYYRMHGNLDRMGAEFKRAFRCYDQALEALTNEQPRTSAWRETRTAVVRASQALVNGRLGYFDEACDGLAAARAALVDTVDRVEADAARAYYEYRRGDRDRALALRTSADAMKVKLGLRDVPLCLEDAQWDEATGSVTAH